MAVRAGSSWVRVEFGLTVLQTGTPHCDEGSRQVQCCAPTPTVESMAAACCMLAGKLLGTVQGHLFGTFCGLSHSRQMSVRPSVLARRCLVHGYEAEESDEAFVASWEVDEDTRASDIQVSVGEGRLVVGLKGSVLADGQLAGAVLDHYWELQPRRGRRMFVLEIAKQQRGPWGQLLRESSESEDAMKARTGASRTDEVMKAAQLCQDGNILTNAGRLQEAEEAFQESLALSEKLGHEYLASFTRVSLAFVF